MGRRCACATPSSGNGKPAEVSAQPVSSAVGKRPRQSERAFSSERCSPVRACSSSRFDPPARWHWRSRRGGCGWRRQSRRLPHLFGRLGPRTTADWHLWRRLLRSAGNSFTLRRVRLILHSKALTLLQVHLILVVVLYLRHIHHHIVGVGSLNTDSHCSGYRQRCFDCYNVTP
ncbi:MAG: hypothetical protein CM15mP103_01440 [Gammaproteobacteria bacterium]|nr:MAG: hypothetical protein CM15mP103_01440 [Gammaproteobacteria bacterium]